MTTITSTWQPYTPRPNEPYKTGGFVGSGSTTFVTTNIGISDDAFLALAYIVLGLDTPELRAAFSSWYRSLPKTGFASETLYNMMISYAYELKFGKDNGQSTD